MSPNRKRKINFGALGLLTILIINVSGQTTSNEGATPFDFQSNLKRLQKGSISSLSLSSMDSIPIVTAMQEKIDERDQRRNPFGYLNPQFFRAITAQNIQEVTEHYVLLVVIDKFGQRRAVTFTLDGVPIESILLNDLLYYTGSITHEVESRRYSPSIPYFYDHIAHEFVFSTIFKIMSPQENNPLEDLHFHDDETTNICHVAVSTQGRFSEARISHVNSPRITSEKFVLTSPFFNQLSDPSEEVVYKKRGDSLTIYLNRDKSLQLLGYDTLFGAATLRLLPLKPGTFIVSQQHKSTFKINGGGDFCDLKSPAYSSAWKNLTLEYDLFDIAKPVYEKHFALSKISLKDFRKLVKTQCGNHHYQFVKHLRKNEEVATYSSISQIVLKIDYQTYDSEEIFTNYVVFELDSGH